MNETGLFSSSTTQNIWKVTVAEFLGTFILVFSGTAVACAATLGRNVAGQPADSLAVGLVFGLTLTVLVYTLGHISGCHLNPAVTIGLVATGKFPWKYAPFYIAAQLLGAVVASLTVWALFGDQGRSTASLGATQPVTHVSGLSVFAVEAIVTFFLVLAVSSTTDVRFPKAAAGIVVGFVLAVCVLIAGPISGGAVNPARALGPMLVAGKLEAVWAYVFGPLLGGVAGAVLYARFLVSAVEPGEELES